MNSNPDVPMVVVGVLALQGAFREHVELLHQAADRLTTKRNWTFKEVRTATELGSCDALIIPGGESTAISLVAQRSNMLNPLKDFVKVSRRPTWGTCAGLILLAEEANRTKKGGQELIGGLDVRVNRNHFGRQIESFEADLNLPFLRRTSSEDLATQETPFRAIFIRAPVVECILPTASDDKHNKLSATENMIDRSSMIDQNTRDAPRSEKVEILAKLPGRTTASGISELREKLDPQYGDIIAVKQGNIFGTSFHPELTGDPRIHSWWLEQVLYAIEHKRAVS
ncbi:hypothetical protein K3495_g13544 [Podosphaera aphanis]|nr:hypothetical protein K3495_g13544 [Podosphaera aphanis]